MNRCLVLLCFATSCAMPSTPAMEIDPARIAYDRSPAQSELARFMRESVNVPFSFAVFEAEQQQRPRRVQHAALVLQDAVANLVYWPEPPAVSEPARDVFYTYARELERQVSGLEVAARAHDVDQTAASLEGIRQTCNTCHHFFRPASVISQDVLVDSTFRFQEDVP
jgi:cytochrome c556